jgi:hypothetical protein
MVRVGTLSTVRSDPCVTYALLPLLFGAVENAMSVGVSRVPSPFGSAIPIGDVLERFVMVSMTQMRRVFSAITHSSSADAAPCTSVASISNITDFLGLGRFIVAS